VPNLEKSKEKSVVLENGFESPVSRKIETLKSEYSETSLETVKKNNKALFEKVRNMNLTTSSFENF